MSDAGGGGSEQQGGGAHDRIVDELRTLIQEYVQIDDCLAEVATRSKILRKKKKDIGDGILALMVQHDIGTCNIQGGTIVVHETKSKQSIASEKNLQSILEKMPTIDASQVIQFVSEQRAQNMVTHKKLKRKKA